uniref:Uncharacterized protein n=1 Tax=Caenorhabditis japonica TaxID=281687 RepID=A0A8R1IHX3_CAEJA
MELTDPEEPEIDSAAFALHSMHLAICTAAFAFNSLLLYLLRKCSENVWGLFARAVYRHGKQFQTVAELKDAMWDKIQPSYLESLTNSRNNRLFQVMQKFKEPISY